MNKYSINFSVDKIELLGDAKSSRFQKAKIYAFADGKNAHTLDIENDVLNKCADTIYDIPILYKYNKYIGDFEGHESDEVPCGFIKEEESNPVVFSKVPDGRTFITIMGTIWKKYSADVLRVFNEDGNKKAVSVEMSVTDSEEIEDKLRVKEFVLEGVTLLGDYINPAVKGANIQLEFSEDKKAYLNEVGTSDDLINNNEGAGELKLTKEELEFAEKEKANEAEKAKIAKEEEDKKAKMSADEAESKAEKAKELADKDAEAKEAEAKKAKMSEDAEMSAKADKAKADKEAADKAKADKEKEDKEAKMSADEKFEAMSAENAKLKEENKAYMCQIETMSDYADLKKFQVDAEEKLKQEKEMSAITKVMSDIENRGITMSESEKTEMQSKIKEFSSIESWSNYVKAQVFDRAENIDGIVKIGLPFESQRKTNSIWDTI